MRISSEDLTRIAAHAAENPAIEACGLLIGRGDDLLAVRRADNVAPDVATAFEVHPATLFACHREARAGGLDVVGCYHSHPGGSALPSPRDIAAAAPGAIWIIAAQGDVKAFVAGVGEDEVVGLAPAQLVSARTAP